MPVLVDHFAPRIERARSLGVERIVVDPGVGFHYANLDRAAGAGTPPDADPVPVVPAALARRPGRRVSLPHSFDLFEDEFRKGGGLLHRLRRARRHAAGADPRGAPRRTGCCGRSTCSTSAEPSGRRRGAPSRPRRARRPAASAGATRPTSRQPGAAYIACAAAWIGTTSRHGREVVVAEPADGGVVEPPAEARSRGRPESTKSVPSTPSRSAGRPWPRSQRRQHELVRRGSLRRDVADRAAVEHGGPRRQVVGADDELLDRERQRPAHRVAAHRLLRRQDLDQPRDVAVAPRPHDDLAGGGRRWPAVGQQPGPGAPGVGPAALPGEHGEARGRQRRRTSAEQLDAAPRGRGCGRPGRLRRLTRGGRGPAASSAPPSKAYAASSTRTAGGSASSAAASSHAAAARVAGDTTARSSAGPCPASQRPASAACRRPRPVSGRCRSSWSPDQSDLPCRSRTSVRVGTFRRPWPGGRSCG